MATKSDFVFKYRVRNWPAYNRALVRRGSLTFWVDEEAVQGWRDDERSGPRGGRPRIYSDTAIECALVVRAVFHLSLRSTQGFLESVVQLMGVNLPVPDYATISRRQAGLRLDLGQLRRSRHRHVVIDTTGLKVFGAGEWYVRKHGMTRGRRRIWRKLHLGVDETTKDIVAVDVTSSGVHDSPHMPALLDQVVGEVRQVSADRAYDSGTCYQAVLERGAVPTIPPRRNARVSTAKDPPAYRAERDNVVGTTRTQEGDVIRYRQILGPGPLSPLFCHAMGLGETKPVTREQIGTMASLAVSFSDWHVHDRAPAPGARSDFLMRGCHITTPATRGKTHYYWGAAFDIANVHAELIAKTEVNVTAAFDEDKHLLERLQAQVAMDPRDVGYPEINLRADGAGIRVRPVLKKKLEGERGTANA